ncbi:SH2 domain-containing protein 4A [Oryzias melastigma]|uniref:SH2 domain-containing protein 4A n=1 Tax=Oryzias melastigma TaxID=30732 RepID=A0A3B3CL04_ORYME|nr:SH2 domain-containing protein 4A isoform X1 [Oryzias melastigma]XP_036071125.1 SH2 domain-containing protein 4A isoform X1 [Oryzias melastigma]KAF6714455.1 SH2 domain-containing protein 4A [Oryzias melastigma]
MLQQVLKDMYVDPDVLAALNEEQKKILFLKMREEQVRRWKEREDKERERGLTEAKRNKPKNANGKSVSWLLGRDGEVSVIAMDDGEELTSKFPFPKSGEKLLKRIPSTKGGSDKTQTENVTPKTKSEISSILKQGKNEETSSSLPLLVSASDPPQPTPQVKVEVKQVGPAKVKPSSPTQRCSPLNLQKPVQPPSVRSSPSCDNAKPPPEQKKTVEDSSRKSIFVSNPDPVKKSDLVGGGQVIALVGIFNAKDANTPAPPRGVKPPLPNKPLHLRPTNL